MSTDERNEMEIEPDDDNGLRMTRRGSLLRLAGFAAAVGSGAAWEAEHAGGGSAAVASGLVSCVLTPELTEGPYYIAGEKVRRNITEGRPGTPLTLRATAVNASTCKPIAGATVDIWHCDAGGVYSGFGSASTGGPGGGGSGPTDKLTFLRGIQKTSASGVAAFQTIYPGWYRGRAVHIHVKVHVGGNVVHTGQFFFPDALTDVVYKKAPYNTRGTRDQRNPADSIFVNGGSKGMLTVKKSGAGYLATIAMGVHA
jgi:protocatechuate 3,4-dioxygenase beta subunit